MIFNLLTFKHAKIKELTVTYIVFQANVRNCKGAENKHFQVFHMRDGPARHISSRDCDFLMDKVSLYLE